MPHPFYHLNQNLFWLKFIRRITMANTNVYVPHLFNRACKLLGVENVEAVAKDIQLNAVAAAFQSLNAAPGAVAATADDMATHYAEKLMMGDMVVFRDPLDLRTYYVTKYNESLVSVFYTLGLGFNIYTVMSTDPKTIADLGITKRSTDDLFIIDEIFGFHEDLGEVEIIPTPTVSVTVDTPAVAWFAPVMTSPTEPTPIVVEEPANQTMAVAATPVAVAPRPIDETVQAAIADAIPETAMGRAFLSAGNPGNSERGNERRKEQERREQQRTGRAAKREHATT
jgi:hypothetical protein